MNRMSRPKERGQSIVLIAVAAIALIAFVSLAIDGGMAYNQRRIAQNAADAAAIAGTYEVRMQNRKEARDQAVVLAKVQSAVQMHGVTLQWQDATTASNVSAYYTNDKGVVIGSGCKVGGCDVSIVNQAWGVKVDVANPFTTFFAGVIGWHEMNVGASSVAVTRAGARSKSGYWAIVATAKHWTSNNAPLLISGGGGGRPTDSETEGTTIIGSLHSNAKFKGPTQNFTFAGQITYNYPDPNQGCQGCALSNPPAEQKAYSLVYPLYEDYKEIIDAENISAIGSVRLSGTGDSLGSEAAPYTYINGNLTCEDGAHLHGLIVVSGTVLFDGVACYGKYLIAAMGDITIKGGDFLSGAENGLYQNPKYELLEKNGNRFVTNGNFSMQGSGNNIEGGIIADRSIDISGSSNLFFGHIIGSDVSISGSGNTVTYKQEYFPPQPDFIELLQ